MDNGKMVGVFALGLGIGAAIALLFAPMAGAETRKFIADKAGEGGEFLAQKGQQLKDTASDLLNRGRKVFESQKDKVSNVVGSATRDVQEEFHG